MLRGRASIAGNSTHRNLEQLIVQTENTYVLKQKQKNYSSFYVFFHLCLQAGTSHKVDFSFLLQHNFAIYNSTMWHKLK